MSIPSGTARTQVTLTTTNQAISAGFFIIIETDILVTKTDPTTLADTVLVINTHYTVANEGTETNAVVTMIGGTVGDIITISRNAGLAQPLNLSPLGAFPSLSIEQGFDRAVQFAQQINEIATRSFRVPITDLPPTGVELNKTSRKSKLLGFDGSGNVQLYTPESGLFLTGDDVEVATVVTMRALGVATVAAGKRIVLTGYYARGDFGAPRVGYWDSSSTAADNGGTVFQLNGVTTGRLIFSTGEYINVKWFGAKGDGATDDFAAITSAIAAGHDIYFPSGNYRTSATIVAAKDSLALHGIGRNNGSTIIADATVTPAIRFGTLFGGGAVSYDMELSNLSISRASVAGLTTEIGVLVSNVARITLRSVEIKKHATGLALDAGGTVSSDVFVGFLGENLRISDCKTEYLKIAYAAEVLFVACNFGRNGLEDFTPARGITVTAYANDIRFTTCNLIPNGSAACPYAFNFNNYLGIGFITLTDFNTEHIVTFATSDSTTTEIGDFKLAASRIVPDTSVFTLHANTKLPGFAMTSGTNTSGALTISPTVGVRGGRISDCFIGGALTLTGGSEASACVTGNTFFADATISGAWTNGLVFASNMFFNTTFTNTATGLLAVIGNTAGSPLTPIAQEIVKANNHFDALASDNGYRIQGSVIIGGTAATTFYKATTAIHSQISGTTRLRVDVDGAAVFGALQTDQVPTAAAAAPSTHKVPVKFNGVQYYFLVTNV